LTRDTHRVIILLESVTLRAMLQRMQQGDRPPQSTWIPYSAPQGWSLGATMLPVDAAAALPAVVSDTEALYPHAADTLTAHQTQRQYHCHAGLVSVRQLVDSTGDIETDYVYDPFGVQVMGSGGSDPYPSTSDIWDADVELLSLRIRYFRPEPDGFIREPPLHPVGALAWRDDVVREVELGLCIGSGLQRRTMADLLTVQRMYFVPGSETHTTGKTNYEPYRVTLLLALLQHDLELSRKNSLWASLGLSRDIGR